MTKYPTVYYDLNKDMKRFMTYYLVLDMFFILAAVYVVNRMIKKNFPTTQINNKQVYIHCAILLSFVTLLILDAIPWGPNLTIWTVNYLADFS